MFSVVWNYYYWLKAIVFVIPTQEMVWEGPDFVAEEIVFPQMEWGPNKMVTIQANTLPDHLESEVDYLHGKGIQVKFSFKGRDMDAHQILEFATQVGEFVGSYGLDGIDLIFDEEEIPAEVHLEILRACRAAIGSEKLLSYSLPSSCIECWKDVLETIHPELTQITILDFLKKKCELEDELELLTELGVPKHKICFAMEIGPSNAGGKTVTVADCMKTAKFVQENELYGVTLYSIQRDDGKKGLPKGTYTNIVYKTLSGNRK